MLEFIKQPIKRLLKPGSETKLDPPVGMIKFGDFSRLRPISTNWGLDRGGAIDRIYIEKFLQTNQADIKGHCLEVMNDNYLKRFGGDKVTQGDILDIKPENKKATIIADLAKADAIQGDTYDCIVLTQTLQHIYDLNAAVGHLYRILKPGGVLLITVPGISHFPHKMTRRMWAFTDYSVQRLLEEQFKRGKIKTEVFGNVKVAASFLYGVGSGELNGESFEYQDKDYQLIIAARAEK